MSEKSDTDLGDQEDLTVARRAHPRSGKVPTQRIRTHLGVGDPSGTPKGLSAGVILGEAYRVERILAEGGMSVVVAARFIPANKRVAIKLLKSEMLAEPTTAARFAREGRTLMRLRSKHAVAILDASTDPTFGPFIVMDYLQGRDLRKVIENGAMSIQNAVDVMIEVCSVLHRAHELGIVHRDVKPDNIFLVRSGDEELAKLIDFGISKLTPGAAPQSHEGGTVRTAALLGSPPYMSPEQLRASSKIDERCDIWAVGATLYEAISGTEPFSGSSFAELCATILTSEPMPLAARREDIPDRLADIVHRCLRKDPDARFQKVSDLAYALLPFAGERGRLAIEGLPRSQSVKRAKRKVQGEPVERARGVSSERSREVKQEPTGLSMSLLILPIVVAAVCVLAVVMRNNAQAAPQAPALVSAEPSTEPEMPRVAPLPASAAEVSAAEVSAAAAPLPQPAPSIIKPSVAPVAAPRTPVVVAPPRAKAVATHAIESPPPTPEPSSPVLQTWGASGAATP